RRILSHSWRITFTQLGSACCTLPVSLRERLVSNTVDDHNRSTNP
ncbi:hypothetical protein X975_00002, partial [Stegodyphus mimosarum]